MVTTRKQTEIQSAAIAHCIAPANTVIECARGNTVLIFEGQDVYSCKSDSSDETYYIFWDEHCTRWECTCAATKPCKHIRAVCEVIQARKESSVIGQAVEVVAEATGPVCGPRIEYSFCEYVNSEYGHFPTARIDNGEWFELTAQGFFTRRQACAWLARYRSTKEQEREQYREFEFQMGSYSIPGLY